MNFGWHRRAVLETDVCIPSNYEIDVQASVLVSRISVAKAWMTEATEIKSRICSARSLVSNKVMEAVVHLINISDNPTTPKAGMVVSDLKGVQRYLPIIDRIDTELKAIIELLKHHDEQETYHRGSAPK